MGTGFVETRLALPAFMLYAGARHRRPAPPLGIDRFVADAARVPSAPVPEALPRRIFLFWLQGLDAAPPIVRLTHASWAALNPGWEVVLLTRETVGDWVHMSDLSEALPIATRSDALRLRLLERHGGVWADATLPAMRPLDDWLGGHMAEGMFAFGQDVPLRPLASWFLAAAPGQPLLAAWRRTFDAYLANRRRRLAYYCVHHTFDWLLRTDPGVRAAWARVPRLSADGPHMLKWLLTRPEGEVLTPPPEAMAQVPMFKLNHRGEAETPAAANAMLAGFGLALPGSAAPAQNS